MNKIFSYVLKTIIFISAIVGVIVSAVDAGEFMGGSTVFMYFTIQSNIAIAIIALIGAIFMFKNINNRIWQIFRLVFTVSITLTGFVFCFVLAPTMGSNAWNLQNILTHVIVPIVSVIDLFIPLYKVEYKKMDTVYVIIPPLLYAIYAGIGFVADFDFGSGSNYPYFFLNWGSEAGAFGFSNELPFIGCFYWIILLLFFLMGIGLLYIKLSKIMNKKID